MKTIIILLCMGLGGCNQCAYGYSSACGAESAEDQKYKKEFDKSKDKNKEKKSETLVDG